MLTLSSEWKHSLNHSTTYTGKKYFIFLANLGRANIVTLSPCSQSSVDLAQGLSQRFVILLESYRYSPFLYRSTGCKFIRFLRSARDFLWVISEAYSVVAQLECTSYQGEALTMGHILKTLYFATIIILQSIFDLVVYPRPESRSQIRASALKTAMYWLDQTLYRYYQPCL